MTLISGGEQRSRAGRLVRRRVAGRVGLSDLGRRKLCGGLEGPGRPVIALRELPVDSSEVAGLTRL